MRVAIITGGTRGIGRGIADALYETEEYQGFILVYNSNREDAELFCQELKSRATDDESKFKIRLVGGDVTLESTRDAIFECFDKDFAQDDLAVLVNNAGQFVGITSDNSHGIEKPEASKKFGDGSLLSGESEDKVDFSYMNFYYKLYGEAFVDLCERGLKRMKKARERCELSGTKYRGSIIGISAPGVNSSYKIIPGYDMPGSGKCVMEFAIRHYAHSVAGLGINCNVIVPGVTRSDAWSRLAQSSGMSGGEEMINMFVPGIPSKEVAEGKDIGDVVVFLSGSGGGRFITGISLRVDGGLHLA